MLTNQFKYDSNMKVAKVTKKTIKVSKRSILRLNTEEWNDLKIYTANPENCPWATITENTKISFDTANKLTSSGKAEAHVVIRMRDFLKDLKNLQQETAQA